MRILSEDHDEDFLHLRYGKYLHVILVGPERGPTANILNGHESHTFEKVVIDAVYRISPGRGGKRGKERKRGV